MNFHFHAVRTYCAQPDKINCLLVSEYIHIRLIVYSVSRLKCFLDRFQGQVSVK
jgi:hypothetical protein